MRNLKNALFMMAIVFALVMSSCSSHSHKQYIPGDSKVVGKLDLKEFFKQSEVDRDKLIKDLNDAYGNKVSLEDCGLDLSEPIYFFARTQGMKISGGSIIKINDKKKVKAWLDNQMKVDLNKEDNGFDYSVKHGQAFGLNDDVLVIAYVDGDESDAKKDLRKIMNKESSGDLDDNQLFNKMDDSEAFACLYADMSIIPAEALSASGLSDEMKSNLSNFRKLNIGVDATYTDGICNFESWSSSDDEKVQGKIDDVKKSFNKISDKAVEMLPDDSFYGFAMNLNGADYSKFIKDIIKDLGGMIPFDLQNIVDLVAKIKGDIVYYSEDYNPRLLVGESAGKMLFVAEGEDISKQVVELYGGLSDGKENKALAADDEEIDDFSDYNFYPAHTLKETSNGYCYNDELWFGYAENAMWFTSENKEVKSPFAKADKPISSNLADFMKDHYFVMFINMDKLKKSSIKSDSDKKVFDAYAEIINKTEYITFSIK